MLRHQNVFCAVNFSEIYPVLQQAFGEMTRSRYPWDIQEQLYSWICTLCVLDAGLDWKNIVEGVSI